MHLLLQRSIGVGRTPLNTRLVPEGIGSVLGFRLRHGGGEGGEGSGEGGGRRRRKGQVVHKLMIRTVRACMDRASVGRVVIYDTPFWYCD